MFGTRAAGRLTVGVVAALALGGLVTFGRLLFGSNLLAATALVFGLCVASVAVGVALGSTGQPADTPYW